MQYEGHLYRAVNPIYAQEPLSGIGAKYYGGRFNAKGIEALYTSLSPETAIKEANQVGALQPTTLVSYKANIGPIFDGRDHVLISEYSMTVSDLSTNTWREEMNTGGKSTTQTFANELISNGYKGLIVPSYMKGALITDVNLVLWNWSSDKNNVFRLIDDENRLSSL